MLLAACGGGAGAGFAPETSRYWQVSPVSVVVSSAEGDRLATKAPLHFGRRPGAANTPVFAIDDSVGYQSITGFGASFNEAGLVALNSLRDASLQDRVLRSLFDPGAGIGLSVMKTPLASTDFMSGSQDWYSYDDTPGDTALAAFSIARDLGPTGLVTYIRRARAAGGDFELQATMDYPPDWMLVDAARDQDVAPHYYDALASYFLEYLAAYAEAGVHIDELSPFNEPGHYTKITMPELRTFIRDHLGPRLAAAEVRTGLQLGEVGGRAEAAAEYPAVLDDPVARSYISSLPYHGYDFDNWDAIASLHSAYPSLPLWMTELCCRFSQGDGEEFASGVFWAQTIMSDLEAGASAWIYWNAILDQDGGPWLVSPLHEDPAQNSQNSVVVIDAARQTAVYSGLYWFLGHFSKFVRPGAVRVETRRTHTEYFLLWPADSVRVISFRNPDGTLVSELLNSSPDAVTVRLDWDGRSLPVRLAGTSITTLSWNAS